MLPFDPFAPLSTLVGPARISRGVRGERTKELAA
jgi:hypothetical protein